ncbi:uncharacterized protein IL334_001262 [Kwoniella shivajii]|uniref:Glucokinase n=1 Tax=Kwoniella shivajii TaxID=564305 RepID=A0ABZ1CRG1_9TREE|nr:hypothetical protein IL334_001262 [Kwoniella shivajii]
MTTHILTPPVSPTLPRLVLCADGGGSKVCVVIRSNDGLQVRGVAGPCNVQSVGYGPASQSLLLATYRALIQLPKSHLPSALYIPNLSLSPLSDLRPNTPSSVYSVGDTGESSRSARLPNINMSLFRYAWLGLAGVNCQADADGFIGYATSALCLTEDEIRLSNDVNLLAAPALAIPGIDHVVAVVAGTGTIGRTIRVSPLNANPTDSLSTLNNIRKRSLPLEDVAISRGWGYLLCDEGSAFWLGRLAIRNVLSLADRQASTSVYSSVTPSMLPLHRDILRHFGTTDPAELINLASLSNGAFEGSDIGEATSKRNAMIASAARVILKWAFPGDNPLGLSGLPTPPASTDGESETEAENDMEMEVDLESHSDIPNSKSLSHKTTGEILVSRPEEHQMSHLEALRLTRKSIIPLIELTESLLGDSTIVKTDKSALVLGGGLVMSNGYRKLLLDGLKKENIEFNRILIVDDAAGEGVKALSQIEFGI